VLVHWNRAEACLGTVGWFRDQGMPVDVIVVDNGSRPDELETLRTGLVGIQDVELIEAGANLGFGPGANVGLGTWLAGRSTEWCLLAPHDAKPGDGCLLSLAAALAGEPMAGLACADVGDGQTPMIDPYFGGVTRAARGGDGWEPADYPHGTLMVLRRGCLEEIGLFDERFFSYCEEADLGIRARAAGWSVGLVRGARVTNTHLGTSVAAVDYLQERNTLRLVRAMSGRYHTFIRLCISGWQLVDGLARPSRRPAVFDARARVLGIRDFLRGVTGPPPAHLYERRR
jgi:N-acetylglucosaminyl-diphospho-decaprenol L-rhamnosyltransferase